MISERTPVPGWPGVHVSELSAADALALQEVAERPLAGTIRLARLTARDEHDRPVWADDEAVGRAPLRLVKTVAEIALRISGMAGDDVPPA